MALRERILAYRERFRRLDRRWHVLIGSQLIVGMYLVRSQVSQWKEQQQQQQQLQVLEEKENNNINNNIINNKMDKP